MIQHGHGAFRSWSLVELERNGILLSNGSLRWMGLFTCSHSPLVEWRYRGVMTEISGVLFTLFLMIHSYGEIIQTDN